MNVTVVRALAGSIIAIAADRVSAAAPYQMKVSCVGVDDTNPSRPIPDAIEFETLLTLSPASPGSFLCNEAVDAPAAQEKYSVDRSELTIRLKLAGSSDFLKFAVDPVPEFGACDLRPYPDTYFSSYLSISEQSASCASALCGHYGIIDPSRPDREIESSYFGLFYSLDSEGHMTLDHENPLNAVSLRMIPTGGDHFPYDVEFPIEQCSFTEWHVPMVNP